MLEILMKSFKRIIVSLLLFATLFLYIDSNWIQSGTSTESISFNLTDRVGTAFGNRIEGSFTLRAQGSAGIVAIKVFFNNEEVYSSAANSIVWRFDTKNYTVGATNITVVGFDSQNNTVQSSEMFEFLDPNLTTTITVFTVIFALVITGLKYRRKFASKKLPTPTKDDVSIQPPKL